jgi:RNA polymerase sigma-70 factor (TIGR02957 family)
VSGVGIYGRRTAVPDDRHGTSSDSEAGFASNERYRGPVLRPDRGLGLRRRTSLHIRGCVKRGCMKKTLSLASMQDNSCDAMQSFNALRSRLHGIAYRMLASVAEAEDIVQDAWLRWNATDHALIESDEAWLVAVTTRICIDRLRAAKAQRECYSGIWLPEPSISDFPMSPEEIRERADDVSVAFLMLLERLTPEARAAFVLREIFDLDYGEVARALGKSEPACRQLVSRAKVRLREGRTRLTVPREIHLRLLSRFVEALESGDFAAITSLLDEDAVLISDGGGRVPSFPKPMAGGRRIAQFFYAARLRFGNQLRTELAVLNGQWALLRYIGDGLESAQSFVTDGKRIVSIMTQRNPEKLVRLAAAVGGG